MKRIAIVVAMLVVPAIADAALLVAGDTCKLEAPVQISAKPGGKGKRRSLKTGARVKIVAVNGHEYEVSTGSTKGFGREDTFDKGCIKDNLPTL